MLDITNIINRRNNIQTFISPGTWQTWIKPRGAKTVDILCIGGGAGGGGGATNTATVNGGNGGGSSAFTKATFNAALLPNILYIYTGPGGRGGIGGIQASSTPPDNTLTTGSISYVTVIPDTGSVTGIVCRSGNLPPVQNTAGTVATGSQMILINLATSFNTVAGQSGVGAISTQVNVQPITILTAGAAGSNAGSGTTTGGVGINAAGPIPGVLSTPTSATGSNGGNGYAIYKPIIAFVGGGGGRGMPGTPGGTGGRGGDGAYGCGGGGGGAAYQGAGLAAVGGNGGNGGNGIVIITTTCQ